VSLSSGHFNHAPTIAICRNYCIVTDVAVCCADSVCFRREKPRQKNSSFNIRAGDGFVDDFSHAILIFGPFSVEICCNQRAVSREDNGPELSRAAADMLGTGGQLSAAGEFDHQTLMT